MTTTLRWVIPPILLGSLLGGCARSSGDRYVQVTPKPYRGPMGGRVVELGTGDTTTAIAGAICDCDGDPVTHSSLIALRAAPNSSDTLRAQLDSATFTLRGLRAGAWHLEFRSIGYRTRRIEAEVGPGLDTILVRLSPSPLVWGDCVCRNGREFGRHCCKPMTYHTCPTEEPEEQGEKR